MTDTCPTTVKKNYKHILTVKTTGTHAHYIWKLCLQQYLQDTASIKGDTAHLVEKWDF